jgi:hypothetical protein
MWSRLRVQTPLGSTKKNSGYVICTLRSHLLKLWYIVICWWIAKPLCTEKNNLDIENLEKFSNEIFLAVKTFFWCVFVWENTSVLHFPNKKKHSVLLPGIFHIYFLFKLLLNDLYRIILKSNFELMFKV